MDRPIDQDRERESTRDMAETDDVVATNVKRETHASTGGAAAAGAVTGGVIGLTGGPLGAAIGAVGGAIVGAAAERMMHGDDDHAVDTADTTAPTEADITTSDVEAARLSHVPEPPTDRTTRDRDTEPRI